MIVWCGDRRREYADFVGVFDKQKTADEIEYGLVGSEMCIRDRDAYGDGVKTGTTDEAGECLVASVNQDGHRTILVLSLIHI